MELTLKVLQHLFNENIISKDNIEEIAIRHGYLLITFTDGVNLEDYGFKSDFTKKGEYIQYKTIENIDIEIM